MFESIVNPTKVFKLKGPLPDDASGDIEADISSYFKATSFDMDESSFSFVGGGFSIKYSYSHQARQTSRC